MAERDSNKHLVIGDSWEELGLTIPASKYNSTDNIKLRHCPECKDHGKRRDNTYDVSVVPAEGKGKCHKCGTIFLVRKEKKQVEKTFTPPSKTNLTSLSTAGLQYFVNRRISQEAVKQFKIAERTGWVAFPYFFNGELVNIKYKNITEKKYTQSPNGMHVLFNYDEAKKYNAVVVCEGEEEVMCWYDAEIPYAVSVDAGAPNPSDKIEKKLECITNCFDLFENADVIYLATDNDENGRRLRDELVRRFDTDKIRIVDFGKYKDGNEFLLYEGSDALANLLQTAKEIRMEGVFRASDFKDNLMDMYHHGLPKGTTTHLPSVDKIWKWREGEVTTVTGYANEGKSSLFDINLPLLKAVYDGWRFALFIPENLPAAQFYEDLIHAYIGMTTDKDYPNHRMSEADFKRGIEFCDEHFFLVYPEEAPTLENLFKRFDFLVRKEGIRGIIIDPFNMVENLYMGAVTYDLYVSRFMTDLTKFTQKRRLCTILVAHQNKPDKKLSNGNWPEPDAYNIKGGGTFFDKTHNLVFVYRPFRLTEKSNPLVQVTSLKIKMKKLVAETGSVDIYFNWKTNRFEDALLGTKNPLDIKKEVLDFTDEIPF
jgi:twinkle protein